MPPNHLEARMDAGDTAVSHAPQGASSRQARRGLSDAAIRAAKPPEKVYKLAAGGRGGQAHWRKAMALEVPFSLQREPRTASRMTIVRMSYKERVKKLVNRWTHGGLARRIYLAFLTAAVLPTAVAGVIGVSASLATLRAQTLGHLQNEVGARTAGVQLFFDQIAAELRFLSDMSGIRSLFDAIEQAPGNVPYALTKDVERDLLRLTELHPHVYQMRVIDLNGHERVRIEKKEDRLVSVHRDQLQDKSDRYYVREALQRKPGELYVSPLDLNEEFGRVELPERPVVRVASLVAGSDGAARGLIVVNLHAQVLLEPLEAMVRERTGNAFLFDRSGHYLHRSSEQLRSSMEPVSALKAQWGEAALRQVLGDEAGTLDTGSSILAYAPVSFGNAYRGLDRSRWVMALSFPKAVLWSSAVNLYALYAVLLAALLVTAWSGYTLSRRLLGPLEDLGKEAEVIADGDFSRRVRVIGNDEIAALGQRFNTMADRIASMVNDLKKHRSRLADEVALRTQELAAERALLKAVFRHAGDAILAVNRRGQLALANTAARNMLQIRGEVEDGPLLGSLWPQWSQLQAEATPDETLRRDIPMGSRVLAVSVDTTTDLTLSTSHVIVARDVSEERKLQDERRQLDRQLFQIEKMATMGELAMGMAHEIGNPLAGMKAVVQSLQYESDIPVLAQEALHRLEAEIDRLSDFLRSFHGFAAPAALNLQSVRLSDAVDDVLFWTRKEAHGQQVNVEIDLPANMLALRADLPQLKQVLLNLVVNALHAMPMGGHLLIAARASKDCARIEIRDTGCGIPNEVIVRIFDPFFTTRAGGSGLGLAITAKIVREHGARIEVDSRPGEGAQFVLWWPLYTSTETV